MYKNDPVTIIPFIGPKQASILNKLGIFTILDLLNHFPVYYKDSSLITTLDKLNTETKQTVIVEVLEIKNIRIRNGKFIQKGKVADESGSCNITWFNQPFITKYLKAGAVVLMSGKLNPKSSKPELLAPEYEIYKEQNLHLGKIVPVYPLTKGLSVKWLRNRFAYLITNINEIIGLNDDIPEDIARKYELINNYDAYTQIHMPQSKQDITAARKRLAFAELLEIYLKLIHEKDQRQQGRSVIIEKKDAKFNDIIASLPFNLTPSQIKAVQEITSDLELGHPMYRLLQGDVGSGKTIVALLSAIPVMRKKYQVVILAPTSILAEQHYQTATKLLGKLFKITLVTANTKNEKGIEKPDLIIATHAILYHKEQYLHRLGYVIIDEQHRFGVEQRRELLAIQSGEDTPHLLHMTATPIPRSVALTLFGEIDVSIIIKPPNRKMVQTRLVPEEKREDALNWIDSMITNRGQIFWICPLIEETEEVDSNLVKVIDKHQELEIKLPQYKIALLHGKMKEKDKTKIIQDFQKHKTHILVSTTVVEVGIDIPDANVIVIENAERYGLAQLHQLRGRVGRNNQESWCLLLSSLQNNDKVKSRLKFFSQEHQGIKIAEFDLQQRGPGEVYGTAQSGIPKLKIAHFGNSSFLELIRKAAHEILNVNHS